MKKMSCVFTGAPLRVAPENRWVVDGEGIATRKWDGTACAVIGGKLFARYDAKNSKVVPVGAIPCDPDRNPEKRGYWVHWLEVTDQPVYRWHREAWERCRPHKDGTYELIGPAINRNPERVETHQFRRHGDQVLTDCPRDFDGLHAYLARLEAEGIVFHHPDGRMAKLRRRDFGLRWPL